MAEDKAKSSPDEAEGNDSKVFSLFCMKTILICLCDTIPMPDPDLKIRGGRGAWSSRPFDKRGGAASKKNFFRPFGLQFGLKIRGGCPPPGPSLGSATVPEKYYTLLTSKYRRNLRGPLPN